MLYAVCITCKRKIELVRFVESVSTLAQQAASSKRVVQLVSLCVRNVRNVRAASASDFSYSVCVSVYAHKTIKELIKAKAIAITITINN